MKKMTRREFMGNSTKAIAGTTVLATGLEPGLISREGEQKKASPSDKISLALIGSGGMGKNNLSQLLRLPEVECPAVADVDELHLQEGLKIVEDARGRRPDGYRDFRKILDRKDIDALVVATPDHWHALPTILGCQAGKDVYVEKPLATSIEEGRAMVGAARKYSRIVQVGTQQRSARHYNDAIAFVQSGELGRLRLVRAWAYLDWKGPIGSPPDEPAPSTVDYDLWLGPAPLRPFNPMRFHHNFRWFWDYSGGLQTDWGAHQIDVALWALGGEPLAASAVGGKYGFPDDIRETPDTQQSLIEFSGYSLLWEHMIGCGVGAWSREHGVEFHGENGILVIDRGGWEVHSETDQLKQPSRIYRMMARPRQISAEDFHLAHIRNFVGCLKSRQRPVGDVELAHRTATVCHLANISVRLQRRVRWDATRKEIVGDAEAQQLVGRTYRKPWALPKS